MHAAFTDRLVAARLCGRGVMAVRAVIRRCGSFRAPGCASGAPHLFASRAELDGGPVGWILCEIADRLPCDAHPFIAAAMVLGNRRASGERFASICGMASRTAQGSLRRLSLPSPHRLLLWGQAMWMLWRMTRLEMSGKQAAMAGGFGTTSAMSAALKPVTGTTPKRLARRRERLVPHLVHLELIGGEAHRRSLQRCAAGTRPRRPWRRTDG